MTVNPSADPRIDTSEYDQRQAALGHRLRSLVKAEIPSVRNTRILVIDLIIAARALHEFRVVAAGHTYATIETTDRQRLDLTRAHVAWTFD